MKPRWHIPVPTLRFVAMAALGLVLTLFSSAYVQARLWALAWNGLCFALLAVDALLAPPPRKLNVQRELPGVLSAGVRHRVALRLAYPGTARIRGELRDFAPIGFSAEGAHQRFELPPGVPEVTLVYWLESSRRGDFQLGDLHVRLEGPLRLAMRQATIPLAQTVKVFPNLTVLQQDALALARASEEWARRPLRRSDRGSEFESLRPWAMGDDLRNVDWKATARRGHPIVRVHQPEKNQTVLLLLDCGRHMAGLLHGRRKLDHAVDAALRVARASLDAGDSVGLLAFGPEMISQLAPRRGQEQLRALTRAMYRVEAQLNESDYGRALDVAFRQRSRRTLVVVFTDLLDRETSASLVQRSLALLPRHLPVLVSLVDEELEEAAHDAPADTQAAYMRHVAAGLDDEYRLNASRLRSQGARVVRAPAEQLGAAAVSEYLFIKGRGLL